MTPQPFVSVIVPTYNRKAWLKECLDSLLTQTYPKHKYEILIVDDGSSDGTKELFSNYTSITILSQKNQGPAAARNLGLSAAQGELIAFTDDDCIPSKDWIEQGITALHQKKLDGIEGLTTTDKEKISPLSVITYTYHGGGFMTCNCFYTRKALDAVGGFSAQSNMRFREDTDLAWRIMDAGFQIGFDERPRVFHRVVKLTPWQYVKKHIRIQEPFWNAYLARYHTRRYQSSPEMIGGLLSTQTIYLYPFWGFIALAVFSFMYLPTSSLLLSLLLFAENYVIVVFLHTRMRSGIHAGHLMKYPREFLGLCQVWWIALLSDTVWKIAGMIRFRTLVL